MVPARFSKRPSLILGTVTVIISAVLFIPNVNVLGLWYDEVVALNTSDSVHTPTDVFNYRIKGISAHPPLYFLLLKIWIKTSGRPDFSLRTLSVLFSLLASALIFRITSDLCGRASGGFYASLIYSSMGFVVAYSHIVLNYSMVLMLAALLLFFYQRYWLNHRRQVYLYGAALTALALLYTHYYAGFLVASLIIYSILTQFKARRTLLRWLLVVGIACLFYLPWVPVLASQSNDIRSGMLDSSALASNWANVTATFSLFLLYDNTAAHLGLLLVALAIPFMRPNPPSRVTLVRLGPLAALLVFGLGLALLANTIVPSYAPRRVIYLLVSIAVLIGYGLAHLPRKVAIPTLAIFLLITPNAPVSVLVSPNLQYRQTVELITERIDRNDVIYVSFVSPLDEIPLEYYIKHITPPGVEYYLHSSDQIARLHHLTKARNRLWVIRSKEHALIWDDFLAQKNYTETFQAEVSWMVVSLYEAAPLDVPVPADAIHPGSLTLPQTFGGMFVLTDYAVSKTTASPGDEVILWLEWKTRRPATEEFNVFTHLIEDDLITVHSQRDGPPSHRGQWLPVIFWPVDVPIYDQHTLTIDPETPPGTYNLRIGLYNPTSAHPGRLTASPGDGSAAFDGIILARIEVK